MAFVFKPWLGCLNMELNCPQTKINLPMIHTKAYNRIGDNFKRNFEKFLQDEICMV